MGKWWTASARSMCWIIFFPIFAAKEQWPIKGQKGMSRTYCSTAGTCLWSISEALQCGTFLFFIMIISPFIAHFKSFWHPMWIQCYRNIVSILYLSNACLSPWGPWLVVKYDRCSPIPMQLCEHYFLFVLEKWILSCCLLRPCCSSFPS